MSSVILEGTWKDKELHVWENDVIDDIIMVIYAWAWDVKFLIYSVSYKQEVRVLGGKK